NLGGGAVCLGAEMGTTRMSYTPSIVFPTAPSGGTCFVADAGTVMLTLGGIPITLRNASIGGEWSGSPATQIVDGLIRGFISERDANFAYIPSGTTGMAAIDCQPLATLLPGGDPPPFAVGDPQPPAPCPMRRVGDDLPANCRGGPMSMNSDLDRLPDGTRGWWLYLNFRARVVPYTER
ncbi:MAG: hypothetical protein NZ898_14165, partial [Myxococcota bacterium]|nr:hypothetical protein [Myxococcota bacterium]